jgi:hypothetical protein
MDAIKAFKYGSSRILDAGIGQLYGPTALPKERVSCTVS